MADRLLFRNQLTANAESNIRQPRRPNPSRPEGVEYYPLRAMFTRYAGHIMACEIVDNKWYDGTFVAWAYGRFLTQADLDANPGLLEALAWTFGFKPLELIP